MISYQPTPSIQLRSLFLESHNIKLFVKREDLNHSYVSGNKWWKLKYNLLEVKQQKTKKILTFGGAYSNHIFATAAAANECGFESIGIIRGEETVPYNKTLAFARSKGMELHFVSRAEYRNKKKDEFIERLKDQFGEFYLIPEGGSNELAMKGCSEFASSLIQENEFDYLCLPVGTGATMAGIICGVGDLKKVIGFSSLKGGDFLKDEISSFLKMHSTKPYLNWEIITDYHFGGYGKTNKELIEFKKSFEERYSIPLDHVYTSKMMAGIFDLIEKKYFAKGSSILTIHTGGLQGNYLNND